MWKASEILEKKLANELPFEKRNLEHMADDAIYRLAHRDAYNASFAARKTQKVKAAQTGHAAASN